MADNEAMVPSERCTDLVAFHEGFRADAYQDSGGVWTIGYGHTMNVHAGDKVTQSIARVWLSVDLLDAGKSVSRLVTVPLQQNQFDALTSLVFNIGAGTFSKSTMLKRLNSGDYAGAAEAFTDPQLAFIKAGGKVLPGLVARREDEQALFTEAQP